MIRIHEIKLKIEPLVQLSAEPKYTIKKTQALKNTAEPELEAILLDKALNKLRLKKGGVQAVRIAKESLDAREKPVLYRVFSLDLVSEKSDEWLALACKRAKLRFDIVNDAKYTVLPLKRAMKRPVVAGFGPCGIFAALVLAKAGTRPIVLERGASMKDRISKVESFWNGGELDLNTNVQFGEGGAGTFSDGKLTTGTKSEYRQFILESFVKAGASSEILYKQKPHIGTDVLRRVVVNLRKEIEALGGEVRFNTRLESLEIKNGKLCAAILSDRSRIETENIILALGHSARDTVRELFASGIQMEQKPFSMGVRIEHPQELIDAACYGAAHESFGIGPADYKLNVKTSSGRGVYTFCMCPGGFVVNASSHEGMVVTNGMSNSNRGSSNANSALLCDIRTTDFESESPLAGIDFQEKYEHLAFEAGGCDYSLPEETLGAFMNAANESILDKCLPDFVCNSFREAVPMLAKKLKGFDSPSATLYGIESRSSSPVRIKRDAESLEALASDGLVISGLYPGGEGAGYAGGIMSAAADGVRIAEVILRK